MNEVIEAIIDVDLVVFTLQLQVLLAGCLILRVISSCSAQHWKISIAIQAVNVELLKFYVFRSDVV